EPAPPAPPVEPLRLPQDLEGPALRASDVPEFRRDPYPERRATGWPPGDPIRVNDLVQLVADIPGLEGMEGVEVRRFGWQPFLPAAWNWQPEELVLDDYCVPDYRRHCLRLHVIDPRACE
ncbi:MAG: hypothetical protein M3340_17225, partial [Actinomycetota bacterium]|nr:hypothetical protein [Actinomycetota bacterium]